MLTLYRIRQHLHTWSRLLLAVWVLAFALVSVANCQAMPVAPDHEETSLLAPWQHTHDQPHNELCSKVCADAQHLLVKADPHWQQHMPLVLLAASLIWLSGLSITILLPQAIRVWPRPPTRPLRLQFSRFNN
ncbi:hypothetical protein [Aquitalea pelogenes]|uniref:hypothetical protein n=1 Tax=Aquitalea pelogenes TaxID=1293573 RepID=UPI00078885B2|nr:hypothetical protein [Aquitalea pelogenes]